MRWQAALLPIVVGLCVGYADLVHAQASDSSAALLNLGIGPRVAAPNPDRVLVDFGGLSLDAFAQAITTVGRGEPRLRPQTGGNGATMLPPARTVLGDTERVESTVFAQTDAVAVHGPDQDAARDDSRWSSWLAAAEFLRSWAIAGVWMLAIFVFFAVLHGMLRARTTDHQTVGGVEAPVRRDRRR
jgi:hypothetical protein